ncbi:hypothetical protein [Kitasatospora sp. NPDC001132]
MPTISDVHAACVRTRTGQRIAATATIKDPVGVEFVAANLVDVGGGTTSFAASLVDGDVWQLGPYDSPVRGSFYVQFFARNTDGEEAEFTSETYEGAA